LIDYDESDESDESDDDEVDDDEVDDDEVDDDDVDEDDVDEDDESLFASVFSDGKSASNEVNNYDDADDEKLKEIHLK
jgi:hypothetical protein